ncbi:FAD dependent oxidoreductase [Collybia nuda]|uniref:FAD dependent oxidoreductase n=1 Tax=Collybia nuda TaxID=64659 RepID=A0A9P5Y7G0_9AGAR|nr:FAD dependent oxidoreductase [Collybia nuda]
MCSGIDLFNCASKRSWGMGWPLSLFYITALTHRAFSYSPSQLDEAQIALRLKRPSHESALPVPNATHSFWINTPGANPLAKEGSEGELTRDSDICIIGSGITGVSAAYHLAKHFDHRKDSSARQTKVVIVDARDFCSGATGRNGGHLTPNLFLDFEKHQLQHGSDEARRIYALENYTVAELVNLIQTEKLNDAVDFVSGGHVAVYVGEVEVKKAKSDSSAARTAGMDLNEVEWLDKDIMHETYGTPHPGFRYPGHNLWPLKLVTALYNLTVRRNPLRFSLKLHTNTPVTSMRASHNPSRRWELSTPRGSIGCSYVIHATNAYASHLLPHMHGEDGIIPTRSQIIALRADAPPADLTQVSWGSGDEYWFPRPLQDGDKHPLVLLGGGRLSVPGHEYYVSDDSTTNPFIGKLLREFLPGMFPGMYEKGREPEMEWTGIMGFTKLEAPFVGPVVDHSNYYSSLKEYDGQYIAAGYTGHGMPRAYACAEVVATMIVANITGETWTLPNWLPRHYLTTSRDAESLD